MLSEDLRDSRIKDLVGNALDTDYSWSFTTENITGPSVTVHPLSQSLISGSIVSLTSAATGSPIPTVQWQVSTNGGVNWSDISGATSASYSFTVALSDNNNQYQAVWNNTGGSMISNEATLTVSLGGLWFDSNWHYRRVVALTNACGSSLTDYQVLISLDNTFDFSHANADGSDIRITNADGITLIPYWIESWDPGSMQAKIWIKIPSISMGSSSIYLNYGNVSATSLSSGSSTFILFDDDWSNPSIWTTVGSPAVSTGIISFASGQSISSLATYSPGSALGFKANFIGGSTYKWGGFLVGDSPPFTVLEVSPDIGTNLLLANQSSNPPKIWSSLGTITNTYHVYELGWLSGETRAYLDHASVPAGIVNVQSPTGPLPASISNSNDVVFGLDVDWVYIRKFSSCEASLIVGAEQTLCPPPFPVVISPITYCENSNAVPVTATGLDLLWYTTSTGGTGNPTAPIPSTAAVGTTSYYVTQTIEGCESPRAQIDIVVNASPDSPTANVTQPSCSVPTGTITVTSSLSGLSFSIDGSNYSNTTGIFTGVNPGNYNLTAKNANGCVSAATVMILDVVVGAPVAPTAAVTQPTCSVFTGTITIAAPTGAGMTYSIDGINYTNTTGEFTNVVPGTYSLSAKDITGCISPVTSKTLNAVPVTPSAPTATVTQPTCNLLNGTITVTSPIAGLSFSIDGSNYTNTTGVFTNVVPGSYNLTAKNISSTCVSQSTAVTVVAACTCRTFGCCSGE